MKKCLLVIMAFVLILIHGTECHAKIVKEGAPYVFPLHRESWGIIAGIDVRNYQQALGLAFVPLYTFGVSALYPGSELSAGIELSGQEVDSDRTFTLQRDAITVSVSQMSVNSIFLRNRIYPGIFDAEKKEGAFLDWVIRCSTFYNKSTKSGFIGYDAGVGIGYSWRVLERISIASRVGVNYLWLPAVIVDGSSEVASKSNRLDMHEVDLNFSVSAMACF